MKRMIPSFASTVRELETTKASFGKEAASRKITLLTQIRKATPARLGASKIRFALRLHETLLFIAAYPDNAAVHDAAHTALSDFSRFSRRKNFADAAEGSGISGTEIRYAFDSPIVHWICSNFPDDVEIDWENFENEERLQNLLPLLTGAAEESGVDDEYDSTKNWLQRAKGPRTDLTWLVTRLGGAISSSVLREYLFDSLAIPLRWRVRNHGISRTGCRFSTRRLYYVTKPLERRAPDLSRTVQKPIKGSHKLSRREGTRLLDIAKATLAVREREMYPISHGSSNDVALYDLDRGLSIAAYGVKPERRFLLEGNWGFLLLMNGIPIGYGCFSSLFGSSEVAANIFETYRQGESAYVYTQLLRVIRRHCGAKAFSVLKYQFGDDNEEAIAAGAFWFYHKLGFRHFSGKLRTVVKAEEKKIARRRGYRTPPHILRLLATDNLYLHIEGNDRNLLGAIPYAGLGHAVTMLIASRYHGDRARAIDDCRKRISKDLGHRVPASDGVKELCLFLEAGGGISSWSVFARNKLRAILKAKTGPSETNFARLTANHQELKQAAFRMMRKNTIAPV